MATKSTKYRIAAVIIICALLCLSVLAVLAYRGRETHPASSFHMLDFNRDLKRSASYDDHRTTYEIFVYSFCDSDGDGIGDLNGIRSKLDYIEDLGFDAIWLTPVHPSSTYHKYDVDDYYAIDPAFGTIKDYESLIRECHERGILVYLDLVLNHTSDDNGWFRAAADYLRELPEGWDPDPSYCKYYDYYNFSREPADGYTHLEGTGWYYEANFWSEMPDLDLNSEAVRDEIRGIMEYWLDKGVDGFRLDAVTSYYGGDTEANIGFLRFLTETARAIDPDCYIVGEAWTDGDSIAALYSSGVDSLFDFPFAGGEGMIARAVRGECPASDLVDAMMQSEERCGGGDTDQTDAPFYTNHDMDRNVTYYGDDPAAAKMAYAVDLLMSGNAFVYYGEETGMSGEGEDENRRAPMDWRSAEEQKDDDLSMWRWFREVIRVRNAFPAIARGVTENAHDISDDSTAAFFRRSDTDNDLLIVMNLSSQTIQKNVASAAEGFRLGAVLNTGEEGITLADDTLSLPAYSIAVFVQEKA